MAFRCTVCAQGERTLRPQGHIRVRAYVQFTKPEKLKRQEGADRHLQVELDVTVYRLSLSSLPILSYIYCPKQCISTRCEHGFEGELFHHKQFGSSKGER